MAEHILLAQTVTGPEDMSIVEAVVRLLLKNEGASAFVESSEYIAAKQNALSAVPEQQSITHNNIRLLIQPSTTQNFTRCTVSVSRVYPNLKPAGIVRSVYQGKVGIPALATES